MLDGNTQEASIHALFEWVKFLRGRLDDSCFQRTGNIEFGANVSYSYNGNVLVGEAVVYVTRNGFDDGKINLRSSDQFDANKVHTEYVPAWQIYSFDRSRGSFEVAGKSNKYGYNYRVVISPN
ncbi:hypothetical protein [Polaromonas sp.]|uniref:hypothetical protein n=1 Tax=Polaromonas sp. TaxID=1869339 RepID=UPI002489120F|nr:hypothetical protein [Polaromonas sp.]MDI1340871.1 hypothetical protein [Polaromonas sp.]